MSELVVVPLLVIAVAVLAVSILRSSGRQSPLLLGALGFQVLASVVHVAIVREYYGYGDMLAYWRSGVQIAHSVEIGERSVSEVLALVLQMENDLAVIGNGRSTGTMHGIAALLCILVGDSLYLACVLISLAGFTGRLWLFAVIRRVWPQAERPLAFAVFFVPSTVFWSAGLLKEAIAVPGLVVAAAVAIDAIVQRRIQPWAFVAAAVGGTLVALTKPYLLFPLLFSVLAGNLVRGPTTMRFVPAILSVAAGVALLGALFPRYAVDSVVDSAEELRSLGMSHAGGSTFGVPQGGLALLVPLGAATALFRPLLFEASSPLVFISALEMTVFSWYVITLAYHPSAVLAGVRRSSLLAISMTFVVVFSVALGISTTNLGTLARYRAPMMPFYGIALVGLSLVAKRTRAALLRAPKLRNKPSSVGGLR